MKETTCQRDGRECEKTALRGLVNAYRFFDPFEAALIEAEKELKRLDGGGACSTCDGTGWTERPGGPKATDVGVVRPLKCPACNGTGRLDGGGGA